FSDFVAMRVPSGHADVVFDAVVEERFRLFAVGPIDGDHGHAGFDQPPRQEQTLTKHIHAVALANGVRLAAETEYFRSAGRFDESIRSLIELSHVRRDGVSAQQIMALQGITQSS